MTVTGHVAIVQAAHLSCVAALPLIGVDAGEEPAQAAVRELYEEAGVHGSIVTLVPCSSASMRVYCVSIEYNMIAMTRTHAPLRWPSTHAIMHTILTKCAT